MIGLYLLAAHLFGDFVLANRWQAARKLEDARIRFRHVCTYQLAFAPIIVAEWPGLWRAYAFLGSLFVLHFLTDSRRFRSTLGDVIVWRFSEEGRSNARRNRVRRLCLSPPDRPFGPPPNPWEPLPLLIDQTLHVAQVAVLGGIFLT